MPHGFTLIELLVALAIFVVLATMAYSALRSVLETRDHVDRQMARLAALQTAFLVLGRDIEQATARSVRDELGDTEPALRSGGRGNEVLALTRTGWRNPLGTARSNLQRVAYGVEGGQLLRRSWNVLDRVQTSTPYDEALLDKVSAVTVRFLDTDMQWRDYWPPQTSEGKFNDHAQPRAVEIGIDLDGWGKITRLFQAGSATEAHKSK